MARGRRGNRPGRPRGPRATGRPRGHTRDARLSRQDCPDCGFPAGGAGFRPRGVDPLRRAGEPCRRTPCFAGGRCRRDGLPADCGRYPHRPATRAVGGPCHSGLPDRQGRRSQHGLCSLLSAISDQAPAAISFRSFPERRGVQPVAWNMADASGRGQGLLSSKSLMLNI